MFAQMAAPGKPASICRREITMAEIIELLGAAAAIGIGATAFMDLWAAGQRRLFGVSSLDYRLVGRWLGHLPRGRWRHETIGAASPVKGEGAIGWGAHYAIGIAFAAALLAIWGPGWAREPSIGPALVAGLSTLFAPFLILQPALGAGVAASRAPRPNMARAKSVITHLSFGIGLFVAAKAWSWLTG